MSIWAEVWTRPGDSSFGRVIDGLPSTNFGLYDGLNLMGRGNAAVADTFDRFDEILKVDPGTPANSVNSLVRYFSDADPTTPIFEWLPNLILPRSDKLDRTVEIAGQSIKSILAYARTEAFDWDGSDDWASKDPDWIYGGDDLIRNGGLEDEPLGIANQGFEDGTPDPWWAGAVAGVSADVSVVTSPVDTGTYSLEIDPILAEGGASTSIKVWPNKEYTVTFRLRGAAGIEYQFGASGPASIVAASPATVVEVSANPGGWEAQRSFTATGGVFETVTLTFTAGANQTSSQISVRNAGAGSWDQDNWLDVVTVSGFGVGTDPWLPTQSLINVTQSIFEASNTQAYEGSWSLKVKALYGHGAYYTVSGVNTGVTYTVSVRVGFADTSGPWGLQIKDARGQVIASDAATIGTGAWTELTTTFKVPDVLPGSNGEITINVLSFGQGAAFFPTAYIDALTFYQGQAPSTVGEILGDLYADATSDHSAVRVVWDDDANPGTPYLTLDFSDSVDSNGAAWVEDISIRIWMRMSFLEVVEQFARSWGYEYRVVPNDVEAGTWLLQVYNPGTMKTDYTTSASPAIQGGSSDTRRSIRRYLPSTDFLVEGLDRITSRDRDSDLISALGRIEESRLDRELPSQDAIIAAAFEDKVDAIPNSASYSYVLVNPQDVPLSDYVLGDLLTVHDPPEVEDEARLVGLTGSFSPRAEEWNVDFAPATAVGS